MGLSLAEAAVRGMSNQTIAEQKQTLLSAGDTEGLISLNHSLFGSATMMAGKDDDADDDDDDDDTDDGDDDDSDDDGDDDDDDEAKGKKKDPKDERIQELSAEAKKRRLRARKDRERIAALEAENERLKKGSKPKVKKEDDEDDDADDADDSELVAEREKTKALEARLEQQTLRTEFNDILADPKQKIKFIDPKAAFRLLDLDDVEIDEDGDVDGMEDAIKALAKSAPYLVAKPKKDEDDDEDDEPKPRRTGQRTGGSRKKGSPNRDALIKKYNIKR
jgi:hypothetical protein